VILSDLLNGTQALKRTLRGEVVLPSDVAYDGARKIWNAMIDRRPALIVRCAHGDDVPAAIRFARDHGFEISIRGGGHNIAGTSVCDAGLMIDLSAMTRVRVDAGRCRAYVEPGATLHDVDRATQQHQLATPLGVNSTTGVAGLTLGGGFGWLTRKHGLTIDNLVSAEVVTADAIKIRASADEHADLFWAIRGGGGNFGVVTQLEFTLHPTGPDVLGGLLVFPFDRCRDVLERYRDFVEHAPEELNVWAVLRKAPPLPFLPAEVHSREIVVLAVFYVGDLSEGERHVERLRRFGARLGEHVAPQPYTAWQQAFDPLLTPGARNYWKSHNFTELSDGAIDALTDFAHRLPSAQSEIFVALIAGAANRVAADATAYAHRDAKLVVNVHGRWEHADADQAGIRWARDFHKASAPYASAGAYVNFMTADEGERVPSVYGSNYERLVQLKRRFDPENVFHMNQNIAP
jgi:FAD/FMN-containing dehydrogenase